MKACAPGKLILSGEHSVVYGAPAIAVAVDRQVTASFLADDSGLLTISSDLLGEQVFQLSDLEYCRDQADRRFKLFEQGKLRITDVLSSPFDLMAYVLVQAGFSGSGHLQLRSDIPAGAGMGSSAAVIAALLRLSEATPMPQQDFFRLVRYCERLQHGRGSAIDAAAVTLGGLVKIEGEQLQPLNLQLDHRWYIWDSGQPESTTGETVAEVRKHFHKSSIWQQFADVTEKLIFALQEAKSSVAGLIQQNQQLLLEIGVVPAAVQHKIDQLQRLGASAKVCGAGAISGEQGGQVLVYLPDNNPEEISTEMQATLQCLQQAKRGASRVND
ncbi:MAG: mevalonate kinase [Neptuniibacter caesariensis]|uniref:mevalonate kinase n=1 Tax=Neptuniibacter caesariensis TaxID=207954 RepID=A0A2G6JQ01_NEPCE|nr:MAG: mevalonate kinase [Neptuniibacter caesariensis]